MKDANPKAIHLSDYKPPSFLIDTTDLTIDLFDNETVVSSTLRLRQNPDVEGVKLDLVLDGQELVLKKILLDGTALNSNDYEVREDELIVFNVPQQFELYTQVIIKPQENTSLEGLYKSQRMYCTQCEAQGFRKITYYLDRPDVMSEFTTTVIADKVYFPVLLSNGNPVDSGEKEDGRHFHTWHDPFKKPAYLFALVAGDLLPVEDQFITQSGRTVDLKIYVEKKDLEKCGHAMTSLKNSMKWDEEKYGREYDLDLFMIVAVDDFNMGAMENKGLNIFNTSCVLTKPEITTDSAFQRVEAVVAHEYFHNWSGNRVTCRDWFQLSLKEGFTVFRDSQFSADMGSPTVKRVEDVTLLRTFQFAEDAGPMSHPVQPASYIEISNFYTLTIYEKGSEIVRMLYNLLGSEKFREGSDLYFERHDGQAVTINEFVQAMAEISGRDLDKFKHWYTQAGTPHLDISDKYDELSKTYTLSIEQSCPATPKATEKQSFHIPVSVGLIGSEGELSFQRDKDNAQQSETVLEITQKKQKFVFNNVKEKPVPSLLRGFSAPVKSYFNYNRDDLIRLIEKDTDGFCRWDACQQLAIQIIDDQIKSFQSQIKAPIDHSLSNALKSVLQSGDQDLAMAALMLRLPSEAYLSQIAEQVDVDAIHHSRENFLGSLADKLEINLLKIYQELNVKQDYKPTAQQIGQRSLKNIALSYLVKTKKQEYIDLAHQQYQQANNMTDAMAALNILINSTEELAKKHGETSLNDFYHRWKTEPLAVDQWLSVQAAADDSNVLRKVNSLLLHESFDINNPNKVRSLIGGFCGQNLFYFHNSDGSGYQFLGDRIVELNNVNPQIAARLLTPLTRWRKYDCNRQDLMKAQLERILEKKNLSKDVYEVVSKSLL